MKFSASSRSLNDSSVSVACTVKLTGSPVSPSGLICWMYHQPAAPATRIRAMTTTIAV